MKYRVFIWLLPVIVGISFLRIYFDTSGARTRAGTDFSAAPQKIRAVSGYVYRAPWNSSGQFVFVSKNFRALMIPEDFEEEALQRMERGCTVRLCGTCSLPEN